MKNTLMFLMVSLLLAFSLTACGGGQTDGMDPSYSTGGGTGSNYSIGGQAGGTNPNYSTGSQTNRSTANGSLTNGARGSTNGARDAMDDMGRDVRNAMDDAGRAVRNTVDGIENAM